MFDIAINAQRCEPCVSIFGLGFLDPIAPKIWWNIFLNVLANSKLLTVIEEFQSLAWNFMRTKQDHIGKLPILIAEMFTGNDVLLTIIFPGMLMITPIGCY